MENITNRIEITSAGGLPQELSQEEFLEGVTAPRNKELIRVFKDVDLIENIGSGVLRILDAYDKSCFKFMDHFLRVSFKYKENPFKYDDTAKVKSSKLAVSEEQILELCKTEKSLKEIDTEIKKGIDLYRKIINVYKHGYRESFISIANSNPEILNFTEKDKDMSFVFKLDKINIEELYKYIVDFLENICF